MARISNEEDMMIKMVAEIGCNHMGSLELAKSMISILARGPEKIDYVKFQKRCNKELLSEEQYQSVHPNPVHAFGPTYGLHREKLEFSISDHQELKGWCEKENIGYSCSVWDISSAEEIVSLNVDHIKIPSACNKNMNLLDWLVENTTCDLHLSLGMLNHEEIHEAVSFFKERNALGRIVLYACTSGYPVAERDLCLLEIDYLKKEYGNNIKALGFSAHHSTLAPDVAAVTLGAQWVERHVTIHKQLKGTDHFSSLTMEELFNLRKSLDLIDLSLSYKGSNLIDRERTLRGKLSPRYL